MSALLLLPYFFTLHFLTARRQFGHGGQRLRAAARQAAGEPHLPLEHAAEVVCAGKPGQARNHISSLYLSFAEQQRIRTSMRHSSCTFRVGYRFPRLNNPHQMALRSPSCFAQFLPRRRGPCTFCRMAPQPRPPAGQGRSRQPLPTAQSKAHIEAIAAVADTVQLGNHSAAPGQAVASAQRMHLTVIGRRRAVAGQPRTTNR